jgi:carbon storage regulator
MLVLTRKVGERLFIGSEIVLTVTKIANNKVSLGIVAPPHVSVHRDELLTNHGRDREKPSIPLKSLE